MKTAIFISMCILAFGCAKNDLPFEETAWQVEKYTNENGEIIKTGIACRAVFSNGDLNFSLDVNSCFGSYTSSNAGDIDITYNNGCTEACCDEPESVMAALQISQCTNYKIKGAELIMTNKSGIEVTLKAE